VANVVRVAKGQTSYVAAARVRSASGPRAVCLQVRHVRSGKVLRSSRSCLVAGRSWRSFRRVALRTKAGGGRIDVVVRQRRATSPARFQLSRVTLSEAPRPETAAPAPAAAAPAPAPALQAAAGSPGCDLYAATGGSDDASGSGDAPFRTAKRLVRSLAPGQTGCLQPGLYVENVIVLSGGRPGAPITLRSAPGGTATIGGYVDVKDTADNVVLTALAVDGSYSPQVTVQLFGDSLVVSDTEITNRRAAQSCVLAGSTKYGIARDLVLVRNRIHGCGRSAAFDHGIYLSDTRNARVSDNVVYDNAAIGIQIYPDADQSLIEQNTIVGNGRIGIIFAGEGGSSSDGNVVRRNVVTHSHDRFNLETWWGGAVGGGNVASDNCVFGGGMGNLQLDAGVAAGDNVVADPLYVDAAAGDFRLRAGSPCAGLGAR
jgi:parallel beta-helix repeat protein